MKLHQRLAWIRPLPVHGSVKALLHGFLHFLNPQGTCFPSQRALAFAAGISISQTYRALRVLKRAGVVLEAQRKGRSSVYTVTMTSVTMTDITVQEPSATLPPLPSSPFVLSALARSHPFSTASAGPAVNNAVGHTASRQVHTHS